MTLADDPFGKKTDPRTQLSDDDLKTARISGFPIVARQGRSSENLTFLLGTVCVLAVGAFTFMSLSNSRKGAEKPIEQEVTISPPAKNLPLTALVKEPEIAPLLPIPKIEISPPPKKKITGTAINRAADRARAPALIVDMAHTGSFKNTENQDQNSITSPKNQANRIPAGLTTSEAFSWRIGNQNINRAYATKGGDPSVTIVQGTLIPAVLETGINSDLPGFTRAVVSQDVRSFDNSTVLIPRGSRLIGQYKSKVAAGQSRAYVIWSRLIRPDGVTIAISSPGTSLTGETGHKGSVNTHFLERFGAALLLTIVGAFAAEDNNTVIVTGTTSAAAAAVQNGKGISPTITVPRGQMINIFTAKDLDFSNVDAWQGSHGK